MRVYENYPIFESETDSWERYVRMCALTEKLCTTVALPSDGDILDCWKSIAYTRCETVSSLCGINYISEALYHIHFRCFSNNVHASNELLLVLLIEEELLRCGFAFRAWQSIEKFGHLYHKILYVRQRDDEIKDYHSNKLWSYLRASTVRRIMLKNRNPLEWGDMLECDRATFPNSAGRIYWSVEAYENAVRHLIPEAVFWAEEWTSEKYIISAVKTRYAVDLTDDSTSFDALISLVERRKEICHCSYELYSMKQFTYALAEGIWGDKADYMMQKCFLDIYRRYKISKRNTKRSRYSSEMLTNSWLYQWTDQKRLADSLDPGLENRIRTALFNIALNI